MIFLKKLLVLTFAFTVITFPVHGAVDSTFHIYLLFGQSNMAGGGATSPLIAADCDTTPRVKVLAFCNCSGTSPDCNRPLNRTESLWYTASPPLHICSEGISPGDWFAKTMLDSIRSDIRIGLIPCALAGQGMDLFMKGYKGIDTVPMWAHPTLRKSNVYTWMVNRCKLAQQTGVIKGILLHQGESNVGPNPGTTLSWIAMTKGVLDSVKKDLSLDNSVPVIVGELRQSSGSCCAGFNVNIDSLAKVYPTCGLASSAGLESNGKDVYHFSTAGMRELGKRYAKALLTLSSQSYIPRKGSSNSISKPTSRYQALSSTFGEVHIYSLDGRAISSFSAANQGNAFRNLNAKGLYIVSRKLADGRTAIVPFIKQ